MATCTHEIGTADTGATPNTSGAFTPVIGDLLIVFVVASATVDPAPTLTNTEGTTFTLILRATYASSAHSIYAFVANQFVTSASSQTVTFNTPADTATGTVIFVNAVAGLTRAGLDAIRQSAKQDNITTTSTPAPAFSQNANTNNPTLGVVGNQTNPATLTEPTGWTEASDLGYATPTTGGEYVFRNSGFDSTTITWGSTSAPGFGSIILEIDTDPLPTQWGQRTNEPYFQKRMQVGQGQKNNANDI